MDDIFDNFQVEHFVESGDPHTSKTYENTLISIALKNIRFERVKTGKTIDFDPAIDIEVLNPESIYSDDSNENSVVLNVTYGEISFLFMGDAGLETEERIMEAGRDINSDILKVGHHAGRSGSVEEFILSVSPEVSIIEVGARNDYGYPHPEILNRLQKTSKVYRTDLDGTIIITTDGSTFTVMTEKSGTTSSGNGTYSSVASTTGTPESNENKTTSPTESSVYVTDLNLQEEWIQISNIGYFPVSLEGWKIEDEGNKHTYTFPSYTLNAGLTVTVFTGKGTDSATELYWQLDDPILNYDGTVYLYDDTGKLVSKRASKLVLTE
ncbi:lamin tail domain-containing protein [Methanosarcina hadiensis]|uniref:lamin tail domain-containing protein n=1 Tax=Methanosarcina hadiensis TaxID=3078083 RepID=UPI0039773193